MDLVLPQYDEPPSPAWLAITEQAVAAHPLSSAELVEVVDGAWQAIFDSKLGPSAFQIGKDIFPSPQIISFLLLEFIALEVARRYPEVWRRDENAYEKDLVHLQNSLFSVEIKASSHKRHVFGNRSYAQESDSKKSKSGYYLTINFAKPTGDSLGGIRLIRFGWLDHTDWIPQSKSSGQQARLRPEAYQYKLLQLYPPEETLLDL